MTVNSDRIQARLKELGAIGAGEQGVNCLAFTPEEQEALQLVERYMGQAGLAVRYDAAGNLIGRKEGRNPLLPVVMTGSHVDTVYNGGIYDGRLGVVGGIEALQVMNETGVETDCPLEVYAYRDEEGARFIGSYAGSRILTGNLGKDMLEERDRDGISARDALRGCGIDPRRIHDARQPKGYGKAHIELHIEQGAVLEHNDLPVGIVTGICCLLRGEFEVTGEPAHAGTTPMPMRRDALCAASEIILAVEREAAAAGTSVATVGRISAHPGGVNVVPGQARFSLDMRDQDPERLKLLTARILEQADAIVKARGVTYGFDIKAQETAAKLCDARLQEMLAAACEKHGLPPFRLQSGAGHDSNAFAGYCPMAMIFVRSRGGISHSGEEYSSPEDCAMGVQILYEALLQSAAAE